MANALLDGVLPSVLSVGNALRTRANTLFTNPREILGRVSQDLQTAQDQDAAAFYQGGLMSQQDPRYAQMSRSDPAWLDQQGQAAQQRWIDMAMGGITAKAPKGGMDDVFGRRYRGGQFMAEQRTPYLNPAEMWNGPARDPLDEEVRNLLIGYVNGAGDLTPQHVKSYVRYVFQSDGRPWKETREAMRRVQDRFSDGTIRFWESPK